MREKIGTIFAITVCIILYLSATLVWFFFGYITTGIFSWIFNIGGIITLVFIGKATYDVIRAGIELIKMSD